MTRPVDAVFIGDSWIDHIGHKTWPEILCRMRGWSYINVAEYGAVSSGCMNQVRSIPNNVVINENTTWIIGVGGNDILEGIYFNPGQNIRAIKEICSQSYGRNSQSAFYTKIATSITNNIANIITHVQTQYGAKNFIVSNNPISYKLPLCRILSTAFVPVFAERVINEVSRIMNRDLLRLPVQLFDQHKAYAQIVWNIDGFHPTNAGHRTLAQEADRQTRANAKMIVSAHEVGPSHCMHRMSRPLIPVFMGMFHAITMFPLCDPVVWYRINNIIRHERRHIRLTNYCTRT